MDKVDAMISAELAVGVGNADSVMVDAVGCADKGAVDGAGVVVVVVVSPGFASPSSLTSVEASSVEAGAGDSNASFSAFSFSWRTSRKVLKSGSYFLCRWRTSIVSRLCAAI